MISAKSLVHLGLGVSTGCTSRWNTLARGGLRRRPETQPHIHWCVGDVGHHGKHVCPCGACRPVVAPEHVRAIVRLPDGTVLATCTCSPDFARTAALGVVDFETPTLP